jgi:hypothetical protein
MYDFLTIEKFQISSLNDNYSCDRRTQMKEMNFPTGIYPKRERRTGWYW